MTNILEGDPLSVQNCICVAFLLQPFCIGAVPPWYLLNGIFFIVQTTTTTTTTKTSQQGKEATDFI